MARWAAFAGLTVLSVSLFLALARASQTMVSDGTGGKAAGASTEGHAIGTDDALAPDSNTDTDEAAPAQSSYTFESSAAGSIDGDEQSAPTLDPIAVDSGVAIDEGHNSGAKGMATPDPLESMSTSALLLNVAFSQGLFGGLVQIGRAHV